jgi:hypothetical protein
VRTDAAAEVELRGILESHETVGHVSQLKNLPLGKSLQIGKHGDGLLPVVAHPCQRMECKATMVTAQMFQQALRMLASPRRVSLQFRACTGDIGGVAPLEASPEFRQLNMLSHQPLPMPCAAFQFALQLQAQSQQVGVGKVDAIALPASDGLKPKIIAEPAVLGAAEANAPGNAAAGIAGQPEGAASRAKLLVIQYYYMKLRNIDQAVDYRAVYQVSQGGQRPGLGTTASAAKVLAPPIQRGEGFKGSDHHNCLQERGGM